MLGAHVAVDPLGDRLGAELRDRVTRVDALRAALVAEVAARAVPDAVLVVVVLQPIDFRPVARVADEAEALRERGRPEELGVGLHRVALGDAAAAHDAERLLAERVHLALGTMNSFSGTPRSRSRARASWRGSSSRRAHVDDEVLEDGHVPHGGDHRDVAASTIGFMRSLQARTARPSIRIPQEPQIIIRQLLR